MEKAIKIIFNWNLVDYPNLDFGTKSKLEDAAEAHIFEMRKEGYTSGELHYEDDNISVWGSWTFSYCAI